MSYNCGNITPLKIPVDEWVLIINTPEEQELCLQKQFATLDISEMDKLCKKCIAKLSQTKRFFANWKNIGSCDRRWNRTTAPLLEIIINKAAVSYTIMVNLIWSHGIYLTIHILNNIILFQHTHTHTHKHTHKLTHTYAHIN